MSLASSYNYGCRLSKLILHEVIDVPSTVINHQARSARWPAAVSYAGRARHASRVAVARRVVAVASKITRLIKVQHQ